MKNRKFLRNILCFLMGVIAFAMPIFFTAGYSEFTYARESVASPIVNEKDINIVVNVLENGTLQVTEKSTIVFRSGYTEYLRDIPYISEIIREDANGITSKKVFAKITNISGSRLDAEGDSFNVYKDEDGYSGFLSLGLKSNNTTRENEERTYEFKYDYYMGDFSATDYQGLYYNIIGSYSAHKRNNINFEVNMPKAYKTASNATRFYYGVYGQSTELARVSAEQIASGSTGFCDSDVTKIIGHIEKLEEYSAVTIESGLDADYFAFPKVDNTGAIVAVVVILALLIIGFAVYMLKQRPEPMIETVEVLPPNNETSAMIEALYKERSTSKGISSMIVYFASKNLLKIIADQNKVTLVKQKEITSDYPAHAQHLFEALFGDDQQVQIDALPDGFYKVASAEVKTLTDNAKTKLYDKTKGLSALLFLQCIPVLTIITCMLAMAGQIYNFTGFFMLSGEEIGLLVIFIITFAVSAVICKMTSKWWITLIISFVGFIISMGTYLGSPIRYLDTYNLFSLVIVLVYASVLFIAVKEKRSKKGNIIKGQVCGFKNYLVMAEKPMLEMLVKETPSYFYDILPYTYALNVSDKWMDKFKDIVIDKPDFIEVDDVSLFDVVLINSLFHNISSHVESGYVKMQESMMKASQDFGGFSDSGGGGFAGGGGGGGGGHAR